MLLGSSPKKRKSEDKKDQNEGLLAWENQSEFLGPEAEDGDAHSCSIKRPRRESPQHATSSYDYKDSKEENKKVDRLRDVITRELNREIKLKVTDLELVDDRLEEAKNLLERLRYAIVAEYYKKQELPQTMIDAAVELSSESRDVDQMEQNQQVPLHPSLKKIIGKRPQNLADIMRACPKREAAKHARHVFNTKSAAERREERRLQKVIREQGIVIDHSKPNIKIEPGTNQENQTQLTKGVLSDPKSENTLVHLKESSNHVLNKARTKNKIKCHFVVGNTSKYIGKDEDRAQMDSNTSFSHKWLVYVQTKDTDVSIEKYVKKVRFYLHPSYRPNDVVDIHEPPFQIARRGWGEFPIRIQLFFHERLQQKPVQLIHQVVLDPTKSGRHILGSETVVEIWLRNETATEEKQIKSESEQHETESVMTSPHGYTTTHLSPDTKRKPRTISFNIKETFDENFFDFLNKIEESRTSICADIEKIEPTLLVNEPLEAQFSNTLGSPIKNELLKSPAKLTPLRLSPLKTPISHRTPNMHSKDGNISMRANQTQLPKAVKDATSKLLAAISDGVEEPQLNLQNEKIMKNENSQITELPSTLTSHITPMHTVPRTSFNSFTKGDVISNSNNKSSASICTNSGKIFNNLSGTVILPVKLEQLQQQKQSEETQKKDSNGILSKALYQKKIFQIKDAQGQIKMVQMFVANPSSNTTAKLGIQTITSKAISAHTFNKATVSKAGTSTSTGNTKMTIPLTNNLNKVLNSKHCTSTPITDLRSESYTSSLNLNISNTVLPTKSSSIPKNVVFQKEGKLYIIDPLQMKLKQQCKNQVSLLKPQVKQQSQQRSAALQSITSDHDYAPPPATENSLRIISSEEHNNQNQPLVNSPQVHLGMRETRLNAIKAQNYQKWQRILFERKFSNTSFNNMRSAVEYLLRRLPLIETSKKSIALAFPFVKTSQQEFNSLPAFKQRSLEWMRAKFVLRLLRKLNSLQVLNATGEQTFWSTREIATYARFHAYTPPIKALQHQAIECSDRETVHGITTSKEQFVALIKSEMKNEQLQFEYNTLSPVNNIINWVDNIQQSLKRGDANISSEEIIIVDEDDFPYGKFSVKDEETSKVTSITKNVYGSPLKFSSNSSNLSYFAIPSRLETAFQLVGDICRDLSIRLLPEEIVPGIIHPSAQVVLAHVSQLFIERLLRQTVANQIHTEEQQGNNDDLPHNNNERFVALHDLHKTISQHSEFDFLTNRQMGVITQGIKNE